MKNGIFKKLVCFILIATMIMTTFVGCGKEENQETDSYVTSVNIDYNPAGQYEFVAKFPEDITDTFKSLSKDDFEMMGYYRNGEKKAITDFNVAKESDKEIKVELKTDTTYADGMYFQLWAKNAVTEKSKGICAFVFVIQPDPDFDINYKFDKGIKGSITLKADWKFAKDINAGMLKITSDVDCKVSLERISDTEIAFAVTDIAENYTAEEINATIKKEIFASEYGKDINIFLNYEPVKYGEDAELMSIKTDKKENAIIDEDNRVSGTNIATALITATTKQFAGEIPAAAVGAALPLLYEMMEIDSSNPEINDIKSALIGISSEIVDMRNIINNVGDDVKTGTNKVILDGFQSLGINLMVDANTILYDDVTMNYVYALLSKNYIQAGQLERQFKNVFRRINVSDYIKNVTLYGDRILGNASGTASGIVELYNQVLDSTYNFESQTIAAKKAFLESVASTYVINALVTIQYCDLVDNGNADMLRVQYNQVEGKIAEYGKQLNAMENRAKAGKDKLLASGQIVSKAMNCHEIGEGDGYFGPILRNEMIGVSTDTYGKMISRARERNCTLAQDLVNAGFTNVTANKNTEYYYVVNTNCIEHEGDGTASVTGKFIIGLFGIPSTRNGRYYGLDLYYQSNINDGSYKKDTIVIEKYLKQKSTYSAVADSNWQSKILINKIMGFTY